MGILYLSAGALSCWSHLYPQCSTYKGVVLIVWYWWWYGIGIVGGGIVLVLEVVAWYLVLEVVVLHMGL